MSDVTVELDGHNRDVLYCRRAEMFFTPNEDGTPSTTGKIIWHTEWWHYSGELLRGKSFGPRIERDVAEILSEDYPVGEGQLPAYEVIDAIKAAFVRHAREHLGQGESENPDPE